MSNEDLENNKVADVVRKAMQKYSIPDKDADELIAAVLMDYEDSDISQLTINDVIEIADASGIGMEDDEPLTKPSELVDTSNVDLGDLLFEVITMKGTCRIIAYYKDQIVSATPVFEGDDEMVGLTLDSIDNFADEYDELEEDEQEDYEFFVGDFPGLESGIGGNEDPYEELLTSLLLKVKSYA